MKTNTSSKIDRSALKAAISAVTLQLGLARKHGSSEEVLAKRAARQVRRDAALDRIATNVETGKRDCGKALNASRRIVLAFTLIKAGRALPETFLALCNWTQSAEGLVAVGALRGIEESKVRHAFKLPGAVVTQVAPESGAVVVRQIKDKKGSRKAA